MRACFLGQNITALGFGVATLQATPLVMDEETGKPMQDHADSRAQAGDQAPSGRTEPAAPRVRIGSL